MPPTKAPPAPKAKGLREPTFISRFPAVFYDPISLSSQEWRDLVGKAPVVRACIATLIMQITGLDWYVMSDDDDEVKYYETILGAADDGAGFENLLSRVIEDCLTVPFGGAWENGHYPNGGAAWLAHLDGGLMRPTYNYDLPYAQIHPQLGSSGTVLFKRGEVSRVIWIPRPDLQGYGWTRTPGMDCLPAIQGLLRSDRFWQTILTDTPPIGILELPGFTEEEAREWLESWKTMLAGIDALKVPIVPGGAYTGDKAQAANFIKFGETATEAQLPELLRRYSEIVCAAFGMNTSDLGLFGQEMRLAGMTKVIELSKRQGLARLMKVIKQRIDNDVLSDTAEFVWADVELEDTVRRASAKKMTAEALAILSNAALFPPEVLQRQAIEEGIITVEFEQDEGPPKPPSKPTQPTGADLQGTKGELGGERSHGPFAPALRQQGTTGDSTSDDYVPPRAYPVNSTAAREMGKLIGPVMAGITRSATRARISEFLDVGLAASAPPPERTNPSPAVQAIEALLSNSDWWKAPDIANRLSATLALAYQEGLLESAGEIQAELHAAGLVDSAAVDISISNIADKEVLSFIEQRGADAVRYIDKGTKHFLTQEIMKGVREGLGTPDIARRILVDNVRRGIIETFRGRALSIVNTETNWAATQASLKQQASVGLTKKVWKTIPSIACDICLRNAKLGPVPKSFKYETAFGLSDGTPGHPKVCLTGDTRVAAQGIAASTERWYNGDLVVVRTARGYDLRCTPNHPILTDHGWIPAGLLVKGDYVISSLDRKWVPIRDHDNDDVPTTIEQISEAFRGSLQVAAIQVPTTAEDFHGDGIGSEVAIIYANRLLGDGLEAALQEHCQQCPLSGRYPVLPGLDRLGYLEASLIRWPPTFAPAGELLAPHGIMGGGAQREPFLAAKEGHAVALPLAAVADRNALRLESAAHSIAAYPIPSGEAIHRLAGEVALDQVVRVDRLTGWSGHVYNLQTFDGFYIGNGIIVKNCHCWMTFDKSELRKVSGLSRKGPQYFTGGTAAS